jgi:hypothetical protein
MDQAGLRLEIAGARGPLTALAAVNDALAAVGTRLWSLDLGMAPAPLRALIDQPRLSGDQAARIKARFLLSRSRVLELIADAGRTPHVAGGGALETTAAPHGQAYPHLYAVEAGADYGRFDRFHVNTADDGTGVDEIMQVLAGGGVRLIQRLPGGEVATLHLDCRDARAGWLLIYDGAVPHIGSLSRARPGTKVLMQIVGPERWTLRYTDRAG